MEQKKVEGKERYSPHTPYREKSKGKENKSKSGIHEYSPSPRARTHVYACTQEEAALAVNEVMQNFGSATDVRLWMWYCRRIGLTSFLEIFDWTLGDWKRGEIKYPVLAFQCRLREAFPKTGGAE